MDFDDDESGVGEELEMLESMFSEEFTLVSSDQGVAEFILAINPRLSESGSAARVAASLRVSLPAGYPETAPPVVSLTDTKGLSDAAIDSISTATGRAIAAADGANCCYDVIEAAIEALSEANDGGDSECPVCLLSISGSSAVSFTAPCFHSYHQSCFCRWVASVERDVEAKRAEEEQSGVLGKRVIAAKGDVTTATNRQVACAREVETLLERTHAAVLEMERLKTAAETDDDFKLLLQAATADVATSQKRLAKARRKLANAESKHKDALAKLAAVTERLEADLSLRVADTPCPVCRAVIPFTLIESFYLPWKSKRAEKRLKRKPRASAGSAAAGAGAGSASPTQEAQALDASRAIMATLAPSVREYLHSFRTAWSALRKRRGGDAETDKGLPSKAS